MKHVKHLVAASMVAILAAGAAHAANDTPAKKPNGTVAVNAGVEANDTNLTKDVKRTLNKAGNAMRRAADDVHALLVDSEKNTLSPVIFHVSTTTDGMIGENILNPKGESIAEVEDIIVGKSGNAQKVVVSDGGLLGIGEKLAAFDYNRVITQDKNDEVVMNLSQNDIDEAKKFSYNRADARKAEVLPPDSISAKQLAEANVYNSDGKKVAAVDNLTIDDGDAGYLIVKFDQTFGLGGDYAALKYDSLNVAKADKEVKVMLTAEQSRQFSDFTKMSKTTN